MGFSPSAGAAETAADNRNSTKTPDYGQTFPRISAYLAVIEGSLDREVSPIEAKVVLESHRLQVEPFAVANYLRFAADNIPENIREVAAAIRDGAR